MSAAALALALADAGIHCTVEVRDRLAVVKTDGAGAAALGLSTTRDLAVRLAAAHGFTHVALELAPDVRGEATPEPPGAPLSRP